MKLNFETTHIEFKKLLRKIYLWTVVAILNKTVLWTFPKLNAKIDKEAHHFVDCCPPSFLISGPEIFRNNVPCILKNIYCEGNVYLIYWNLRIFSFFTSLSPNSTVPLAFFLKRLENGNNFWEEYFGVKKIVNFMQLVSLQNCFWVGTVSKITHFSTMGVLLDLKFQSILAILS